MTDGSAAGFMTIDGFRAYLSEHANDVFGAGDARMCPVAAYLCSMRPGSVVGTVTASVPLEHPIKTGSNPKSRDLLVLPKWARQFIKKWDRRGRPVCGRAVITFLDAVLRKEKRSDLTRAS